LLRKAIPCQSQCGGKDRGHTQADYREACHHAAERLSSQYNGYASEEGGRCYQKDFAAAKYFKP
jgi:hypothetical protein